VQDLYGAYSPAPYRFSPHYNCSREDVTTGRRLSEIEVEENRSATLTVPLLALLLPLAASVFCTYRVPTFNIALKTNL
jgi:hypothetical protein